MTMQDFKSFIEDNWKDGEDIFISVVARKLKLDKSYAHLLLEELKKEGLIKASIFTFCPKCHSKVTIIGTRNKRQCCEKCNTVIELDSHVSIISAYIKGKDGSLLSEAIKPCICDGSAEIVTDIECQGLGDYVKYAFVKCNSCGFQGRTIYKNNIGNNYLYVAIREWNKWVSDHTNSTNWISVDDKLPNSEQMYLCFTTWNGGEIEILERVMYGWYNFADGSLYSDNQARVTHWMPLPSFPNVERREE